MTTIKLERKKEQTVLPNQYNSIEELLSAVDEAEKELRSGGGYTTIEAKEKIKE